MIDTLRTLKFRDSRECLFYSLPALEEAGIGEISRLPVSIRIILESVLRNCDGERVTWKDVETLANWNAKSPAKEEIPFVVARIVLQDFTGVPLLVDLAAMRSAATRLGGSPGSVEPMVPVDLIIDHSVQVDFFGSHRSLDMNLEKEFERNHERYEFLKWGQQAFDTFKVIPPGIGIIHQVNLEYLAKGVLSGPSGADGERRAVYYPDTLVGTDSHTTMINGLGVVGWGVGGIEAEAGMLGQPVYFLTPEVVGVNLSGAPREGVTATDMVLHITNMLRSYNVVGKFVEYFGEGAAALSVTDRSTIANMAPEYGATMGFFGIDEKTVEYMRETGRDESVLEAVESYYKAQGLWGVPRAGEVDYSDVLELDLGSIVPGVAGPKRPQDRIDLADLKPKFASLLSDPLNEGGYGLARERLDDAAKVEIKDDRHGYSDTRCQAELKHGSVLIASITSCTNTSNPGVMLGAGILAKKAVERGLRVSPVVKTSLAPGSRVVSDYLQKADLQKYLDRLGFHVIGFGCATCIGNSGPLHPAIEEAVLENDLVSVGALSGNRNFEARIHPNVRANFLMSPPLVVAFALAGRIDIDLSAEPLGYDRDDKPVFLKDIWPASEEIQSAMASSLRPEAYKEMYADFSAQNPGWNEIPTTAGETFAWRPDSTYIQEPPFFDAFQSQPDSIADIRDARALAIFGDSVTTDHISPAGAIKPSSPAGRFLLENGIEPADFNSYGSRRGNDKVMTRGTFANVRIKNRMIPGVEGGYTLYFGERETPLPDKEIEPALGGKPAFIYDASMAYQEEGRNLVVFAGHEYGTGSSRDWAAKGTALLGVKAVVAESYERIHRSNLCGMGVLPLQFPEGVNAGSLGLDGSETFDILGLCDQIRPQQEVTLQITRKDGTVFEQAVILRIDTPIEVQYYRHGGILPYIMRRLLKSV